MGVASKIGANARCLAGFAERDARPTVGVTVSAIARLAQMRQEERGTERIRPRQSEPSEFRRL